MRMATSVLSPRVGRDALEFRDAQHPGAPLVVHTYRPASHGLDDPVVLVQHGIRRNGDEYRDYWIEAAERYRLLVAATTFPDSAFPQPENYNDGQVVAPDGTIRARDRWLYAIPPRVLEALYRGGATRRRKAFLYGHSAGGQFVHRLAATQDHAPYEAIAAANAGWYTLPALEKRFPAGLDGLGMVRADVVRWLSSPMTILAGDRDIDADDAHLPRTPAALAQGATRFERAHYFFDYARKVAFDLGIECRWELVVVPGVAHDGAAMGRAAAERWFYVR